MRVAALYDIHANLPALEAVLEDVRAAGVDRIVFGGDIVPGPMPRETLDCLASVDIPAHFIYGNGDRAVLAQIAARHPSEATYWGTTSGKPLPEPVLEATRWTGEQLEDAHAEMLRSWPSTVRFEIPALGAVLFCHGTPRSETEVFTRLTREALLIPVFEGLDAAVVVCGHTHMPFDRMVGRVRVVNAGSVGMPFGRTGADWLLIGPDVQPRHTSYDLERAAERVRATHDPQAAQFAHGILAPPSEEAMLGAFTNASFR